MVTPEEAPTGPFETGRRWRRRVQALTLLAVASFCAILVAFTSAGTDPEPFILTLPTVLFYLWILWRLRGKKVQKGLALLVVVGSVGFLFGLMSLWVVATDPCDRNLWSATFAGLFSLTQATLVPGAIKTSYVLRSESGDDPHLGIAIFKRVFYAGLPLFFILAIAIPNMLRSRMASEVFTPVGGIRSINTAEITYVSTYNTGYSPTLSALGPEKAGAPPSASGLLDSLLASGVRQGYAFEYKPGPVEKAHIESYTLAARPLRYGCRGENSYYSDQTGVIRWTHDNRPPTVNDPVLE